MRLQSLAGGSGCFAEHSGFLVDREAARRGLFHEAGSNLGQGLLERGAVEAAAGDGLPSDLERASQKRVIIAHGGLDLVFCSLISASSSSRMRLSSISSVILGIRFGLLIFLSSFDLVVLQPYANIIIY